MGENFTSFARNQFLENWTKMSTFEFYKKKLLENINLNLKKGGNPSVTYAVPIRDFRRSIPTFKFHFSLAKAIHDRAIDESIDASTSKKQWQWIYRN